MLDSIVPMMDVRYYVSLFPTEALIASQLEPKQFGTYMATGSKRGSAERIIFAEILHEFEGVFDWDYARRMCMPHSSGDPKHSVYLGVYRVFEHIPAVAVGSLYLTTRDGRTLEISRSEQRQPEVESRAYYIYQELCPITPVIVSRLEPEAFGYHMTDADRKVYVPKMMFADLKTFDFEHPERSGNVASLYDRKIPHLMACIAAVTSDDGKIIKTLDRSHVESFSFQSVDRGFYLADGSSISAYPMPSADDLKSIDYDWGRSALIL